MKKIFWICSLVVPSLFFGCDDDGPRVSKEERAQMETFATARGLTVSETNSGILYEITVPGTGEEATLGNIMEVDYIGYLMDGTVFDTSIEQVAIDNGIFDSERDYIPLRFLLDNRGFIPGWRQGMYLLNDDAEATLIIPSYLAYGKNGIPGVIPGNSPIAFEVEVIDIER
jgi:FKBP-type peptidyl-prolyl cis-trans isomerase